ncbi:MAG: tetratricopeptide repeat protein [Cyanobacteria bacterium SZAS LIN-3]|nr:tetratricopeptide repeat protein [Cyanobacteria bacterium SZAS LIN-3]
MADLSDEPQKYKEPRPRLRGPDFGHTDDAPDFVRWLTAPTAGQLPAPLPEAEPTAEPDLISSKTTGIPQLPTAPKLPLLPYGVMTIILVMAIVGCSPMTEVWRAQTTTAIIDSQGPAGRDFVDMRINLANVLQRRGMADKAEQELQEGIGRLSAMPTPAPEKEIRLQLRIAAVQIKDRRLDDGVKTIEAALKRLEETPPAHVPMPLVWQLNELGKMMPYREDDKNIYTPVAIQLWRAAAKYWQGGNPVEYSNFDWQIADAQLHQGQFADAAKSYVRALDKTIIRGDRVWRAQGFREAAYCFNSAGNFERGAEMARTGLAMAERLGNSTEATYEKTYCRYLLGHAEGELGHYRASIEHITNSLEVLKSYYPGEAGYTYALWYLANSYRDSGDYINARKFYDLCISETQRTDMGPYVSEVKKDLEKLNRLSSLKKERK